MVLAEVIYQTGSNREQRREATAALATAMADAPAQLRNLHRSLRAAQRSLGNERRQRDSLQAMLEQASARAQAATAHAVDVAREAEEVAASRDDLRQARVDGQRRKRLDHDIVTAEEAGCILHEELEQQLIDAQEAGGAAR